MDAEQRREFDRELEMNLAISRTGVGRFRLNIFKQRNDVSIVIRNVKLDIRASKTSNCRRCYWKR
jgi:twitching motility protein PilU